MIADSPIVAEVRKRRCELSERFGNDLRAYYEHIREVQHKYQSRVISQSTVVPSRDNTDSGTSPRSRSVVSERPPRPFPPSGISPDGHVG
jgi:hypothetical protein